VPTPASNTFLQLFLTKPRVKLCDFSEAYIPGLPRLLGLATAHILCPSEVLLSSVTHASTHTDIWALVVLIHMLFTGGCGLFCQDADDRMLREMVQYFGRSPELW
jgi:hypothetical protein